MLSYQHAYHAGNFADCHKHALLCAVLARMAGKDSAITYYDFFAGRGQYMLQSAEALKTGEYINGIARLWSHRADAPDILQPYFNGIAYDNKTDLARYPGSPLWLKRAMRPQDYLVCIEAHPQEHDALLHTLQPTGHVSVHKRDAWEAMNALLPPKGTDKTPRTLAVIDPAYEVKSDYTVLVSRLEQALQRWSHGVYFIWYPLLSSKHHEAMLDLFRKKIAVKTLHSQLLVQAPAERGMYGSGLLVINPPWKLDEDADTIGAWLAPHLAIDKSAQHVLEWVVQERNHHEQ